MLSNFLHGEQGALLATVADRHLRADAPTRSSTPPRRCSTKRATSRPTTATCARRSSSSTRSARTSSSCSTRSSPTRAGTSSTSACRSWSRASRSARSASFTRSSNEPLIKRDHRSMIMQDEARHVAFGVLSLKDTYADMPRERAPRSRGLHHRELAPAPRPLPRAERSGSASGCRRAECEEAARQAAR